MDIGRVLGYSFKDGKLLERALTLSSYDNEFNNQTLEFFGDAILEFIVTERLFDMDCDEGELTERRQRIVSDSALAEVSNRLGLSKFLIKDKHDSNNKKAVPSVYEAIIAAIYLDGGLENAKKFVLGTLDFSFKSKEINYKGELQELLQSRGERPPEYKTRQTVLNGARVFEACVKLCGREYTGTGEKKKQAEQAAAKAALEGNK